MVRKPDGTWRPCGDYRRLNLITKSDKYPLPHIQDVTTGLNGATIFSKFDLQKGFWQIPVAEDDIHKTAVITPFGLFEFTRMPFGLSNAAQAFQRLIDRVCDGLEGVHPYVDDILVASRDPEEHRRHVEALLDRLVEAGLVLHPDKCVYGAESVPFLGHEVSAAGVKPLPAKVSTIAALPKPQSVKAMQRFLGMLNFFNRFLPAVAVTTKPLYAAVQNKNGRHKLTWDAEMDLAFEQAKQDLASADTLAFPHPSRQLFLAVDASDIAVGATLFQMTEGHREPLGFFSKRLSGAQKKYAAFDRELLAAFLAVKHWFHVLEGRQVTIYTDHQPLVTAIRMARDASTNIQARYLSYISAITTDIQYLPGVNNQAADCLSRPEAPAPAVPAAAHPVPAEDQQPDDLQIDAVDYQAIAAAQQTDSWVLQHLSDKPADSALLKPINSEANVWCDTRLNAPRPLLPASSFDSVVAHFHRQAHLGAKAVCRLLHDRFLAPRLQARVKAFVNGCKTGKVTRYPRAPLQAFTEPSRRFATIHVDLIVLPPSRGKRDVLTIIDRVSRWPEAVPLSNTRADTVAKALIDVWISRYGDPDHIVSDRGAQFTSGLWDALGELAGFKPARTTAYHPQANGMVERFHRVLKDSLRAQQITSWVDALPLTMLSLRSAPREALGASSAEFVFGQPLTLPGDFRSPAEGASSASKPSVTFLSDLRDTLAAKPPPPPQHHSTPPATPALLDRLQRCEWVFLRDDTIKGCLKPKTTGPYRVLKRGPKFFKLDITGKHDNVSIDRLQPAAALVELGDF